MNLLLRTTLRSHIIGARICLPRPTVVHTAFRIPIRSFAAVPASSDSEPVVTATNRKEFLKLRFWKDVGVEERSFTGDVAKVAGESGYVITLDKRALKTPSGSVLAIPKQKKLVATLIAMEWDNQETLLKQHSLPMTSLASRAIDAFGDHSTRAEVRALLLKYLETDTLCFHQSEPAVLKALQEKHWDPLLDWTRLTYNAKLNTTTSFLLPPHPSETMQTFDKVMEKFDPWEMAAMERAVYTSKSFIVALALVQRRVTAEQAALASHVEVNSQIEKWGEVEDSHDVDFHDVRRQLGSVACLLATQ
ncbi:hypothetical protein NLI96_g6829 [Meripilus lineatus]|uniref:ATP12-domain-containing protein n=1 Tax=Meripilus lineatus TaxID=2056292 RepID=A0AAD5V5J2_9APHY|nr:hypothetical protein NLI96_g6829 [Physisporinus lineatus]